jgi:hypothetical protein
MISAGMDDACRSAPTILPWSSVKRLHRVFGRHGAATLNRCEHIRLSRGLEMKNTGYATGLALSLAFMVAPAHATELWDPQLRGVDEGMLSAANPPPGVYGILNSYFMYYTKYDNNGHPTNLKMNGVIEAPVVVWSTGVQVLGADYAVFVAQPFDYVNVKMADVPALSNNAHLGNYNSVISPAQLSWALPGGFFAKAGVSVYLDDGSSSPAHPPAGHGAGSANSYMTIQPDAAFSWLHDGWNLSVEAHYDHNLKDSATNYTSGQEISLDYTITKTFGKWTVGMGFYQQNQINSDSGAGAIAAGCPRQGGCKVEDYGGGPLVGYDFGGLSAMLTFNHNFYTRNEVAGDFYNVRFVKPF